MKQKLGRKLLSFLLTLAMVVGLMPGMSLTAKADGNVATVGGTEYATLSEALNAWNDNTTLTLLSDVTTSSTVSVSGTKTLDLNGYGIRMTGTGSVINVTTSGNLTLQDSDTSAQTHKKHFITLSSWRGTAVSDTDTASAVSDGSGVVEITGGYITGGYSTGNHGGGVNVSYNGTFTMNGGTVIGNRTPTTGWQGGGVNVSDGTGNHSGTGTFTMDGGEICYNFSNWGGGINSYGTVTINGSCVISHNTANCGGGGIELESGGKLYMNGGFVSYNRITGQDGGMYKGGGVHVPNGSECHLQGNVQITNNYQGKDGVTPNNMFVRNEALGKVFLNGQLDDNASIGVGTNRENGGVFTGSANKDYNDASKFTSDNASYAVGKNTAGQLVLGTPVTVTYNANGHGTAPTAATVASGSVLTAPTAPTADGYTFGGWYKEQGCTNAWNFSADTVTAATTLYAKWTPEATAPTISSVTGAELTYGYTEGGVSVTATAADGHTITGYQWYSSTTASTTGGAPIESATSANYAIPTGKAAGTTEYYYCVVTATRSDNNKTATATSDVATVTVSAADPATPTNLTATYGQTLENVTLPDGWAWKDSTTSVGNVGTNSFKADYTATSTNYNSKSDVDVSVTVSAADPATPTNLTATYGQTLENVTLPDGWAWKDSTTSVGNVGTNSFKADYTATSTNYNSKSDVDVSVTVSAADPATPTNLTATYGQTLADVTLPNGWAWKDSATSVGNVGTNSFKADYTAMSTNYNSKSDVDVSVTVGKANSAVTTAPTAKTLTYTGSAQELVNAGSTNDGKLYYAVTTENKAPTDENLYTTSIPTKTEAGTYYVWYKVKGDDNHTDTTPVCIPVTISAVETVTVTFEAGGGTGSMTPARMEKGSKFTFPSPEFFPPADRAFAHWKIGEKQYGIDDAIIVTADITVTAVWTEPKSRIETNDLTSVPKELKNTYSSITALKKALLSRLSSNGIFASEENTEFHDVELMVQLDGIHWVKATEANFPVGKLTVKLAYPSGTGMNTHNFKVAHMFTTNVHGHTPGEIETPSVTKKEDGIYVDLDGLSPVAVSWNKIDEKAIGSLPQTGDTERPLLYGLFGLIALVGLGLLIKKK